MGSVCRRGEGYPERGMEGDELFSGLGTTLGWREGGGGAEHSEEGESVLHFEGVGSCEKGLKCEEGVRWRKRTEGT